MTILITLTTVGIDCSTFDIYSNVDGFLSAFETDIPKGSLLTGFSSANVPDGTTIIRVKAKGVCTNYIDLQLINATTTTTSTTTSMCTLVINSTVTTNPTNINEDDSLDFAITQDELERAKQFAVDGEPIHSWKLSEMQFVEFNY